MAMYKVPGVKARNQQLSTSCWLTCLEMLFAWKGKNPNNILETMDQSPNLFPYYMKDNGIAASECKETAKMLGLCYAGDTGVIDAGILTSILQKHGPILINGYYSLVNSTTPGRHHHAILVTGCDPSENKIRYIDTFKNYMLEDSPQSISWLQDRRQPWISCDASMMYW